jgi:ATPase subunit of ABC transporter with duplicated ATPase domains
VPQELDATARQQLLHGVRRLPPAERGRVLSLLAALGSDPDRVLASASPSPGEARKLALAGALGGLAHAVVLDEPSNDLDLPAVQRVETAISAFPGAVVLVTHDDRLAAALTRATWTVAGGTVHA